MTAGPPLLTRTSRDVDPDMLEDLLLSLDARTGPLRIEHPEGLPPGAAAWLCWDTGCPRRRRGIRYSEHETVKDVLADPEKVGRGVRETLIASLDPARQLCIRTSEDRLAALICAAFSELVPNPEGVVDTVDLLMPNPWTGMVAARICMPPFSSGVTSFDNDHRKVHAVPELASRVDASIAPTAMIIPESSSGGPTIRIVGGMVKLHRRVDAPDVMQRMRETIALDRALEIGIVPLPPSEQDR
jgi:hypothetical protein